MGFAVCRIGDMTTGHECWPPQPVIQGSPTVYCGQIPVMRVTDACQPHCCVVCHPTFGMKGSNTVYVNNLEVMRVTDLCDCGSRMMTGSANVFAGSGDDH